MHPKLIAIMIGNTPGRSYRAVTTKHVGLVAREMGDSEAMVKRCYFDRQADEVDGGKWFSTGPAGWVPPVPEKVT